MASHATGAIGNFLFGPARQPWSIESLDQVLQFFDLVLRLGDQSDVTPRGLVQVSRAIVPLIAVISPR